MNYLIYSGPVSSNILYICIFICICIVCIGIGIGSVWDGFGRRQVKIRLHSVEAETNDPRTK